jgi:hypothetical protein
MAKLPFSETGDEQALAEVARGGSFGRLAAVRGGLRGEIDLCRRPVD